MLASNRAVTEIIKNVPDTVRLAFISANEAGATNDDIEKLFNTFQTFLDEYKRTLMDDSMFYAECANNPYIAGTTANYSYPHFLHVLKQRMEAAMTLEERELLRQQHYNKLSEYKFSDSVVLGIVTDKLLMGLATPTAVESFFSRLLPKGKKQGGIVPEKRPAITPKEKVLEQPST